jgi:hypothetical protein
MSNTKKENIIVRALLIGIISGILIGFTGEQWDFRVHRIWTFDSYGTTQAVIGGVLVALSLFLFSNTKD